MWREIELARSKIHQFLDSDSKGKPTNVFIESDID